MSHPYRTCIPTDDPPEDTEVDALEARLIREAVWRDFVLQMAAQIAGGLVEASLVLTIAYGIMRWWW